MVMADKPNLACLNSALAFLGSEREGKGAQHDQVATNLTFKLNPAVEIAAKKCRRRKQNGLVSTVKL